MTGKPKTEDINAKMRDLAVEKLDEAIRDAEGDKSFGITRIELHHQAGSITHVKRVQEVSFKAVG